MLMLWCVVAGLISKVESTVQSAVGSTLDFFSDTVKVTFPNIMVLFNNEPVNVKLTVVPLLYKHKLAIRIMLKML